MQSGKAWFCTILSAFGVVILSVIAHLFNVNHESFVGSINDPEDGPAYVKSFFRFLPYALKHIDSSALLVY